MNLKINMGKRTIAPTKKLRVLGQAFGGNRVRRVGQEVFTRHIAMIESSSLGVSTKSIEDSKDGFATSNLTPNLCVAYNPFEKS